MSNEYVGANYDTVPENLRLWLNVFRNEWLSAATQSPPSEHGVPHVTQADGRHGVLQRALSMRATTSDHRYRRFLTVDRNLSHFEEVDMPTVEEILHSRQAARLTVEGIREEHGLNRTYDDSKADLIRKVVEDVPGETTMERLLPDDATPSEVADRVVQLSEDFEQVSDEGLPKPGNWDPAENDWDYYTSHSKLARTQRKNIAGSLETILSEHPEGGQALDPRIANLVFADLDTADDVLPVVDRRTRATIAALAEEPIETAAALGFSVPVDADSGAVQNSFKREYQGGRPYVDASHPLGAGEGRPDKGTDLFTDAATLDALGDPSTPFEKFVNYAPDEDLIAEFVPLYAKYRARNIPGTDYRWDYHPLWPPGARTGVAGIDKEPEENLEWFDPLGVELKYVESVVDEHVAAYQKLAALHRSWVKWGRGAGVLSSLLAHLLRFGRLRNAVTNYASDAIHGHGGDRYGSEDDPLGVLFGSIDREREYDGVDYHHNATGSHTLVDMGGYNTLYTEPDDGFDIHPHQRTDSSNVPTNVALGTAGVVQASGSGTYHPYEPSLRHLYTVDLGDLEWQTTSTLELSSHRLDAWWTSIAARRLAELRKRADAWYDPTTGNLPPGTRDPTLEPKATPPEGDGEEGGEDFDEEERPRRRSPRRPPNRTISIAEWYAEADFEELTGPMGTAIGPLGRGGRLPTDDPAAFGDFVNGGPVSGPGAGPAKSSGLRFLTGDLRGTGPGYEVGDYVPHDRLPGTDAVTVEDGPWVSSPGGADSLDVGELDVSEDDSEEDAEGESAGGSGIYVGAWGFVENLEPDPEGRDHGEYVHAPSIQQATTAALLRGGNKAYEAKDEGHLSAVDLSPDRVRLAQRVLDGVRDGQSLSRVLGYRFERALQEEDLQTYVLAFRKAFPSTPENRDRDEASSARLGAKYDVVDGYALYGHLNYETGQSGVATDRDYPDHLPDPDVDPAVKSAMLTLVDAVDAVRDLLTAESVHQFAQGNFSRARVSLDAVAADGIVPDIDVVDTPRTETSITHRLSVAFGDPATTAPSAWTFDNRMDHPTVPSVGSGDESAASVAAPADAGHPNGHRLQMREHAEPNLDAWIGDALPAPANVGCSATFEWTAERAVASGSFTTPIEPGRVSVTDVGFRPDVVLVTASAAVGRLDAEAPSGDAEDGSDEEEPRTTYGWTHGAARRRHAAAPEQHAVSVGYAADVDEVTSAISTDRTVDVVLQGSGSAAPTRRIQGDVVEMTEEGFEVDVSFTAGDEAPPVVVEYLALKTGDLSAIDVGHFAPETVDDPDPKALNVDAEQVLLVTTDGVDASGNEAATTDAVGISRGRAVDSPGGVTEQVVSVAQGPGPSSDPTVTVDGDASVSLPGVSGSVTRLGTQIDLSFPTGDGSALPVTYVALEGVADAPAPELGVASPGENDLDGTFRPAAVEVVAVPGLGGADVESGPATTTADGTTAGVGFGVAAGPAAQRSLSHTAGDDPDGGGTGLLAAIGGAESLISVATTDADGGRTRVTGRLTALTDNGFTLEFPGTAPDDVLLLYRAWPAVPVERQHALDASLTLDELLVTPLDVLFGSEASGDGALTELERRMGYYLLRSRMTKVDGTPGVDRPPVPGDATVDLALRDAGDASLSAADFLEVVRAFRQVVGDGRAATADDFVHPAERAGTGYDRETYDKLRARAEPIQDAVADVTALLTNRVEALDREYDADGNPTPTLTEQVEGIQDALETFRSAVELPGVSTALDRLVDASNVNQRPLGDDLAVLAAALPAGPTDPADVDAALQVAALANRELDVDTPAAQGDRLTLELRGFGLADTVDADGHPVPFERNVSGVVAGADGAATATVDLHDVAPGTRFSLTVLDADNEVVAGTDGHVVAPQAGVALDAAAGQRITGSVDTTSATDLTVAVRDDAGTTSGLASIDESVSVTTDKTGEFAATVDLTGADPGTPLVVTATDDAGTERFRRQGYVRQPAAARDAAAAVAGGRALEPLLWLDRERESLDPMRQGSPAFELHERLYRRGIEWRGTRHATDWSAIQREVTLVDDWRATAGSGPMPGRGRPVEPAISAADIDTLSTLTALSNPADHELGALSDAVRTLLELPDAAGVTDLLRLTGGRQQPDNATVWSVGADVRKASVRGELAQLLRNPDGNAFRLRGGFAPEFVAFVYSGAPTFGTNPDPLFDYLDALFDGAGEVTESLRGDVDRPDRLLAGLRDAAVYPSRFVSGAGPAPGTVANLLSMAVEYYVGPGLGALDKVRTAAVDAEQAANDEGVSVQPLDEVDAGLDRMYSSRREEGLRQGLDAVRTGVENFVQGPGGAVPEASRQLKVALDRLETELNEREPWRDLETLDRLLADVGSEPYLTTDGTTGGTPTTECLYLLSELRPALSTYEGWLTGGSSPSPVYQPAASRQDDAQDRATALSTLASERSTVAAYVDVARSTRLDEVFRRCVLETVRLPLIRAAYLGAFGSVPTAAIGGEPSDVTELLGQARGVADRLGDRLADARTAAQAATSHAGAGDYADAAERELERLEALFDDGFTVLPLIMPANGVELSRTFTPTHEDELLSAGGPMEVETWFQRQARVRDRAAGLREALTYAEMIGDDLLRDDLRVGQIPYRDPDHWVGIDAEDGTPGRPADGTVSMVSYFASTADGGDSPVPSPAESGDTGHLAALYVDDWRVAVPATEETTGLAVNYDDPGMEPPQSILLAVPPTPDERERSAGTARLSGDEVFYSDVPVWTDETLVRTVLEAIDLLKMRGVDLDALGTGAAAGEAADTALGHLLPGLVLPQNTRHRPDVPSVDVRLDADLASYLDSEYLKAVELAFTDEVAGNDSEPVADGGGEGP